MNIEIIIKAIEKQFVFGDVYTDALTLFITTLAIAIPLFFEYTKGRFGNGEQLNKKYLEYINFKEKILFLGGGIVLVILFKFFSTSNTLLDCLLKIITLVLVVIIFYTVYYKGVLKIFNGDKINEIVGLKFNKKNELIVNEFNTSNEYYNSIVAYFQYIYFKINTGVDSSSLSEMLEENFLEKIYSPGVIEMNNSKLKEFLSDVNENATVLEYEELSQENKEKIAKLLFFNKDLSYEILKVIESLFLDILNNPSVSFLAKREIVSSFKYNIRKIFLTSIENDVYKDNPLYLNFLNQLLTVLLRVIYKNNVYVYLNKDYNDIVNSNIYSFYRETIHSFMIIEKNTSYEQVRILQNFLIFNLKLAINNNDYKSIYELIKSLSYGGLHHINLYYNLPYSESYTEDDRCTLHYHEKIISYQSYMYYFNELNNKKDGPRVDDTLKEHFKVSEKNLSAKLLNNGTRQIILSLFGFMIFKDLNKKNFENIKISFDMISEFIKFPNFKDSRVYVNNESIFKGGGTFQELILLYIGLTKEDRRKSNIIDCFKDEGHGLEKYILYFITTVLLKEGNLSMKLDFFKERENPSILISNYESILKEILEIIENEQQIIVNYTDKIWGVKIEDEKLDNIKGDIKVEISEENKSAINETLARETDFSECKIIAFRKKVLDEYYKTKVSSGSGDYGFANSKDNGLSGIFEVNESFNDEDNKKIRIKYLNRETFFDSWHVSYLGSENNCTDTLLGMEDSIIYNGIINQIKLDSRASEELENTLDVLNGKITTKINTILTSQNIIYKYFEKDEMYIPAWKLLEDDADCKNKEYFAGLYKSGNVSVPIYRLPFSDTEEKLLIIDRNKVKISQCKADIKIHDGKSISEDEPNNLLGTKLKDDINLGNSDAEKEENTSILKERAVVELMVNIKVKTEEDIGYSFNLKID